MAGLFNTDLNELQATIKGERMLEASNFLKNAQPSSLFAPVVQGAYGLIQQTRDTLSPDPRMQKAQALEMIKKEASKSTQPGTVEHFQKLAELSQQAGFTDAAEYAMLKAQELGASQEELMFKRQKNQMDMVKTQTEIEKNLKDLKKPSINYGDVFEASARANFGKNFEDLTPQEAQQVQSEVQSKKVQVAQQTSSALASVLSEKGNAKLGEKLAGIAAEDILKIDSLTLNINRFKELKSKVNEESIIQGGGSTVQKVKQTAYSVLGDMGWLNKGELDSLATTEQVAAELNKLIFDTLGGLGAQVSDADRLTIEKALGSLGSSPTGLLKVFSQVEEVLRRERMTASRRIGSVNKAIQTGNTDDLMKNYSVYAEEEPQQAPQQPPVAPPSSAPMSDDELINFYEKRGAL